MARVKRSVNAQKKRREILKVPPVTVASVPACTVRPRSSTLHSMTYAYRDRRARKGEFRKLWIARINAAARLNDMTYNRLMQGLRLAGIEVDRKVLADIAVTDVAAFTALVDAARKALPEDVNAPAAE